MLLSWDDALLFSGSGDHSIGVWDAETLEPRGKLLGHSGSVYTLRLSSTRRCLYSGSFDNLIFQWDFKTRKVLQRFKGFYTYLSSLVFSSDESVIYSLDADNSSYIK